MLSEVEMRRIAQKRRAAESAGARREQRRRRKGSEGRRHAQKGLWRAPSRTGVPEIFPLKAGSLGKACVFSEK